MKNPRSVRFLSAVLSLILSSSAFAQLTLNEATGRALCHHPQLKAAKSDIAIAQARLIDAGKLDNPVFEFALESMPDDGPEREGSIFLGYSQKFPVTAKLLFQRDLGIADIRVACAEVRDAERKFVAEVQKAYIEAVGARALIQVLREFEDDANDYIKLARQKLDMAQGSELDVASAETEKLLATQARNQAESEYREALEKLKPLVGICSTQSIQLSQNLDGVIAALRSTAQYFVPRELRRSDIVLAELRLERACVNESLARAESVEDWEIEAGYETARTIDEPVGAERDRFLGLGIKIPLPVRKKGEGRVREACAESEKAAHQLDGVKLAARGEAESRIIKVKSTSRTVESLTGDVLQQLRDREAKTLKAYESGLVDFSQVILLRQQQNRTREAAAVAKLDQAKALAALQLALGSNPLLKDVSLENCPSYKCGTDPKAAPFAVPHIGPSIQAAPVSEVKSKPEKTKRAGIFGRKIFKGNRG